MTSKGSETRQLLYRAEEVAELLGIGRTRVFALVKSGDLRSVKIGTSRRVPHSAVVEYVHRLEQAA
jgi:excisionase family DNA binding protein